MYNSWSGYTAHLKTHTVVGFDEMVTAVPNHVSSEEIIPDDNPLSSENGVNISQNSQSLLESAVTLVGNFTSAILAKGITQSVVYLPSYASYAFIRSPDSDSFDMSHQLLAFLAHSRVSPVSVRITHCARTYLFRV